MYVPASFRPGDRVRLADFMRRYGFATLVSGHGAGLSATHVPLLFTEDATPGAKNPGALSGHMARANPHWRELAGGEEVLAIFHGPHGYISPSWYEEFPSVPTWNYAVVHAYGIPRLLDAPALRRLLEESVERFEGRFANPWRLDLSSEWAAGRMEAVVGFEIEVTRLEGKLKLSQNRTPREQAGVIAALRASGDAEDAALAAFMETELGR